MAAQTVCAESQTPTEADAATLRDVLGRSPHPALQENACDGRFTGGLHLAVMTGSFLDLIIARQKTVESRFHRQHRAPLFGVQPHDVVVFRQSGQPARLAATIGEAHYLELGEIGIDEVRTEWADRIGAYDDDFWDARADASWVTLLTLQHLVRLPPVYLRKRDRRGWVTYPPAHV